MSEVNTANIIDQSNKPLTNSQLRRQALPDLLIPGCEGEFFSPASIDVQAIERVVFEPWDESVDKVSRDHAFRDVLGTYRSDRRVRTVVGNYSQIATSGVDSTEWSFYTRQSRSYQEVNTSDTALLAHIIEQGLQTYVHLWNDQERGEMNFISDLYNTGKICKSEDENLAHLTIAHDILTLSSLGLVRYLAHAYGAASGVDRKDLYQAGVEGAMASIRRGGDIYWGLVGSMKRLLAEDGQRLGLTTSQFWTWWRIKRDRTVLSEELGRRPTIGEIAKRSKVGEETVKGLIKLKSLTPDSINRTVGHDDDGSEMVELLGDSVCIEEEVNDSSEINHLREVFSEGFLRDDELFVLGLHYGFATEPHGIALLWGEGKGTPLSYQEIVKTYMKDTHKDGLPLDVIGEVLGISYGDALQLAKQARNMIAIRLQDVADL